MTSSLERILEREVAIAVTIEAARRAQPPDRMTLAFARDLAPVADQVVELRIPTRPSAWLTRAEASTLARLLAAFLQDTR